MKMTTSANLDNDILLQKYAKDEIDKIKYINKFDEIVGISELDEKETINFLKSNKIENVTFIQNNNIVEENKLSKRFEVVVKNGEIVEYRKDPSYLKLMVFFLSISSILAIVGMSSQHVYLFLLNNYFV
jgi:hypothetical protein